MATMRMCNLFVLLFSFSQILFTSAVPADATKPTPGPNSGDPSGGQLLMGVGITADNLTSGRNPRYEQVVNKFFTVLTPGNELKWGVLDSGDKPGKLNFAPADTIYQYAKQKNKQLRLHTLFAKTQNTKRIGGVKPDELKKMMEALMGQVIQRYGDRAIAIDVCNEILSDQGGLDNNVWLQKLGPNWVKETYKFAAEVRNKYAKNMLLYINDFSIEGINAKSDTMLKLATDLYKAKILDAVGFQSHFEVGKLPYNDFQKNLERFTQIGLKVALTEVDVRINLNGKPQASQQDLDTQAKDYLFIYETCRKVKGCVSVTTWGVTPGDSWIGNIVFPGFGDATLFDNNYQPTKAMQGLKSFFPQLGTGGQRRK
ncbi:hypothetical protein MJO29_007099 [Puccinia striiformis f. sp. tritici]|nr:hypothetical protein MJO29_007099 [Puccinia striiformis f. sp. tritici]